MLFRENHHNNTSTSNYSVNFIFFAFDWPSQGKSRNWTCMIPKNNSINFENERIIRCS